MLKHFFNVSRNNIKLLITRYLERLIIKHKVGYYRENAPPRVIMEDRIKHLIQLGNKELCWDNKPRMLDRMQKFYCLEEEIKSLLVNLQ
jgi:hypothetical protein